LKHKEKMNLQSQLTQANDMINNLKTDLEEEKRLTSQLSSLKKKLEAEVEELKLTESALKESLQKVKLHKQKTKEALKEMKKQLFDETTRSQQNEQLKQQNQLEFDLLKEAYSKLESKIISLEFERVCLQKRGYNRLQSQIEDLSQEILSKNRQIRLFAQQIEAYEQKNPPNEQLEFLKDGFEREKQSLENEIKQLQYKLDTEKEARSFFDKRVSDIDFLSKKQLEECQANFHQREERLNLQISHLKNSLEREHKQLLEEQATEIKRKEKRRLKKMNRQNRIDFETQIGSKDQEYNLEITSLKQQLDEEHAARVQ